MIDKEQVEQLRLNLQRIFTLKIGRTTFRELQNTILEIVKGNRDQANQLFEALLKGEFDPKIATKDARAGLDEVIHHFCIPSRMTRDIFERGDFVQVITSDLVRQDGRSMFINRLRRVDGEEMQFVGDLQSTLHLAHHFISRVAEYDAGQKDGKALKGFGKELSTLKRALDILVRKSVSN